MSLVDLGVPGDPSVPRHSSVSVESNCPWKSLLLTGWWPWMIPMSLVKPNVPCELSCPLFITVSLENTDVPGGSKFYLRTVCLLGSPGFPATFCLTCMIEVPADLHSQML